MSDIEYSVIMSDVIKSFDCITNLPWGHMSITGYKFQNNEYLSFTYQISRIRIIYCKGIILLHSL